MALEALVFAGAGVVVGSRVRRQQLLMLATGLIAIPLWLLSGGIGPVQLFPETLVGVARWLPTTYAFDAINDLVLLGATPQLSLLSIATPGPAFSDQVVSVMGDANAGLWLTMAVGRGIVVESFAAPAVAQFHPRSPPPEGLLVAP